MQLKKILIVDNEESFQFLNKIFLRKNNIDCLIDEVIDGTTALEYLDTTAEPPNLILLDLNMPGMDGFDFLEKFEKLKYSSKIFVLTSSAHEGDKAKAMENKLVTGYFEKPLTKSNLKEILSHFD